MQQAVTFTVTVDDIVATQRLATRRNAFVIAVVFALLGIAIAVLVTPAGLVATAIGVFVLVDWRWPVLDRWLIRRRAAARIGVPCEVWLDGAGVAYRQAGQSGHIAWEAITRIVEDDRTLLLMQGGLAVMALPKRAFDTPQAADRFLTTVRQASGLPT